MASKWRKVIDPETGKARFTNEPVTASSAPVNASVQVAQTRVGDAVEVPVCACGKAIDGRVVTALQRHWHARCFACTQCNREFEGNVLRYTVINDDEAWCRRCCEYAGKSLDGLTFHALESFDNSEPITLTTRMSDKPVTIDAATGAEPRSLASALTGGDAAPAASGPSCARCSGGVSGHVVEWSGNTYHPGCFLCGYCELPIESATGFNVHEEQPHHKECFKQARAPKCGACQQPCTGKSYNVKGTRYHVGCFKCAHCAAALGGGFFTVEGNMYCKACKQAGTTNPAAAGQAPAPTAAPTAVASAAPATDPPTTSTTATPKFCGECGASRPSGARFCGECGSSFSS